MPVLSSMKSSNTSSRKSSAPKIASVRRELAQRTLSALWAQWDAIGGLASGAVMAHKIVDPEALVLTSLFFQDDEPRLRDILYAWVEVRDNAPLLSVRRMRTL